MTALADIRKSMLAVATLKGSDLAQFNEEHPRDEKGRFASVTGSPALTDPRAQRLARARRRRIRAAGAAQADVRVVAQETKEETKPPVLQRLLRLRSHERIPPKDVRTRSQEQEKPALDDDSYMTRTGKSDLKNAESVVFVTMEEAKEFLETGHLNVGAANKRWDKTLTSAPVEQSVLPSDYLLRGTVAIRFKNPHYIKHGSDTELYGAQRIQPIADPKARGQGFTGYMGFTSRFGDPEPRMRYDNSRTAQYHVRVIDATAWSPFEVKEGFHKADEVWDEEEHPRDWDSGRFVSSKIGRATPPGQHGDPRAGRMRRRRRRIAGAVTGAVATAPVAPPDVRVREPALRLPARREVPRREIALRPHERIRIAHDAAELIPDLPEDVEATLTHDTKFTDPAARRRLYEETGVYPEMRESLRAADDHIQRAASGEINADTELARADRVSFSRKFLTGQRTESQYDQQITDADVAQAIGQLQASQRLFNTMYRTGTSQWQMVDHRVFEQPERKEATSIGVTPGTMADLLNYRAQIEPSDVGYGVKAVSVAAYKAAQQINDDRVEATRMHRDMDRMRRDHPEQYQKVFVTGLLKFTAGELSYDEAMEDIARTMGNEGAARHHRREQTRLSDLSYETFGTWYAGAERSYKQREANADRQARIEQAREELAADPRVRTHGHEFEADTLTGWFDEDGNPKFRPGMTVDQVPTKLRPAFERWERARARKANPPTS